MSERELDSSVNEYNEIEVNEYQTKQSEWDMAIGLQEVDNLKPSPYLQKLLEGQSVKTPTYKSRHARLIFPSPTNFNLSLYVSV